MSDLVELLRHAENLGQKSLTWLHQQAADEITRLTAALSHADHGGVKVTKEMKDAFYRNAEVLSTGTVLNLDAALSAVLSIALTQALAPTLTGEVETPAPVVDAVGREAAIRKAGQVVIDDLIDRGGWCIASDDDLADYMTRIVDACARAALATTEGEQ